jgi:hypothetical protein
MVKSVRSRKIPDFLAAGGALSHYVADAAIPLHTSHLHHGSNPGEKGVHAQFETKMVERYRAEIVTTINGKLRNKKISSTFQGAQKAAETCIELAKHVMSTLPPQTIIDSFNSAGSGRARNEDMWEDLGPATLDCLVSGTLCLATIWESAWIEGGGNQIPNSKLIKVSKTKLKNLYKKKSFLESNWLEDM